jgi:hypothetical protein
MINLSRRTLAVALASKMKWFRKAALCTTLGTAAVSTASADWIGDLVKNGKKIGGEVSARWKNAIHDVPALFRDVRDHFRDNDTIKDANVILFEHTDGSGDARGFRAGDSIPDFHNIHHRANGLEHWVNWHDRFSSLTVEAGYRVRLFANENFGGRELVFDGPCVVNLTDHDFNDAADSIKVEKR